VRRLALLIALTLIASPVRAVGADQLVGTSSSPTNDVSTSHLAAPATLEAARELVEFSAEELKQISKFYRTPVGMKLAASFPVMDREFAEKNLDLQLDFMIEVLSRLGKDQSTAR
jgi:hypothetical protein